MTATEGTVYWLVPVIAREDTDYWLISHNCSACLVSSFIFSLSFSSNQGIVILNYFESSSSSSKNGRSRKQMITHTGKDDGEGKHSFTAGGCTNWYIHYATQCGESLGRWELIWLKVLPYHSSTYTQRTLHLLTEILAHSFSLLLYS